MGSSPIDATEVQTISMTIEVGGAKWTEMYRNDKCGTDCMHKRMMYWINRGAKLTIEMAP